MLIHTDEGLESVYQQILDDAASTGGGCSVVIFVAPNCDAMCACRILTSMLRSDAVSYKIKPVSGYGDIAAANEELIQGNEDLRSVVLLNCGAISNVETLLSHLPAEAHVYVADSNRPIHLNNVHADMSRVLVLQFGDNVRPEQYPSDGEGLEGDGETSDEDSDSDSDREEEEQLTDGGGGSSDESDDDNADACRVGEADRPGEGEGEGDKENLRPNTQGPEGGGAGQGTDRGQGDDSDDDQGPQPRRGKGKGLKRKRPTGRGPRQEGSHTAKTAKELVRERRERIRRYYGEGSYHGTAAAIQLFQMAQQVNKDTNDLLWLAIVGLTDQYIHQRVDGDDYVLWVDSLRPTMLAKNSIEANQETMSADGTTTVPVAEDGHITYDLEFRFMLHRHWSLYESMYFSNYVAAKLNVWNSNGRQRLEEFLAKMGLSLSQCKQKYPFMSSQLRKRLKEQIEKYSEDYGLEDIFYGSYQRHCGFKSPLSAADMVYCITALVEHVVVGHGAQAAGEMDPEGGAEGEEVDSEAWLDSFNTAYDALSGKSPAILQRGLELSMSLQKAVVQQAVSMVEKRALTLIKHFRYAFIRSNETDERLFTQPLALGKLAAFLIDIHRENGKWAGDKARPLVIMAERPRTFLVVGVTCPGAPGESDKRNRFGQAFRLAADQINARVKHDGFESSVMEIAKDDMHDFIQSLHDTMNA